MISKLYVYVAEIPECSSYGAPSTFLAFSGRPAKNTGKLQRWAGERPLYTQFHDIIFRKLIYVN